MKASPIIPVTAINKLFKEWQGGLVFENSDGVIVFTNDAYCNFLRNGDNPADITGEDHLRILELRGSIFRGATGANELLSGVRAKMEVRYDNLLKMADDSVCSFDFFPVIERSVHYGNLWHFREQANIYQDEYALLEKEERLKLVLENTLDAVILINEQGEIIHWNPSAENIFGWRAMEVIGKKLTDNIIPNKHRENHDKGMRHFLDTGKGPLLNNRLEMSALHKDGHEFPVELTVVHSKIQSKHYFAGFLRDISARKEAQTKQIELLEELEKVNSNLNDFAYIVSHDLKAPLRGIHALTQWIVEDNSTKLEGESIYHLEMLQSKVSQMHRFIDTILEYSRIGRIEDKKLWFPLEEVIVDVQEIFSDENLQVDIEEVLPEMYGERIRMTQVIQNLVSNAIKYNSNAKKKLKISILRTPKFIKLYFQDNGIGIEEEYIDKIFQMFQTLHPKEDYDSTGVGLALVKKIVEGYQGTVRVKSKPGQGSTFILQFPNSLFR